MSVVAGSGVLEGDGSYQCCLHVVIPTHNRKQHLERCLDCLSAQDDVRCTVTVIDDGSTDGTAEFQRSRAEQLSSVTAIGYLSFLPTRVRPTWS